MALPNDGELSVRDLQIEAFIPAGNENQFTDLAELYDIDGYNPAAPSNIILAESFYGETLNLTATTITVTPTTLSLPNNGGGSSQYTNINVSSNGSFLIVNKPNWIGIDDSYYTSGGTIRIYRFDNSALGSPERSATLEFRGSGGITRRTLSITQSGNPIELTLNPSTSQTLSRTASTLTQDVTVTNPLVVTGTVVGDGMTLSSPSVTNLGSTSRYRFTLSYTTNDTTSTREAAITFNITGDTFSDVRNITHTQTRLVPSLSIATSTLSFVQGGETKSFNVVSNTDWTSDITGTGFQQSFSSISGFTTSNLSGDNNDTIYIKALVNEETSTRNGSVRVEVDGGSPFDTVSLSQAAFVETLSIATSLLSFNSSGETEFFDVVSNTDWTSDITGTGYQQSFSSTSGFTTSNLSGNGDDRIYIKIAANPETYRRDGSVFVSVLDGNPFDSVSFRQNPKPIWVDDNILISGFDVDEFGDITVPSILTSLPYSVTYTTSANAGTSYSAAAGFPLVQYSILRYVNVTVDVPSTYQNPGLYTRTAAAYQEERYYDTDEITISGFSVDDTGAITVPSISATDSPTITTTYTFGPNIGSTTTVNKGFPVVLSDINRYVNVTLTVPSGWFNTGTTITRTQSTVQPGATLDGDLYYPANSTSTFPNWSPGSVGGSYTNNSFFGATETTPAYLTFSLRTNVIVEYNVQEFGHSSFSIVQPTNDFALTDNEFTTQLDITPYSTHFRLKVNPVSISQGTSVSTTMIFTTTDTNNANFEIDITLGKLQGSSVGVNPSVRPKPIEIQQ